MQSLGSFISADIACVYTVGSHQSAYCACLIWKEAGEPREPAQTQGQFVLYLSLEWDRIAGRWVLTTIWQCCPTHFLIYFLLLMQIFVHRTFKVWCITTLKIHQHSLVWLFPWVSHVFNAPALCQYMPYGMNTSVRRPSSSLCNIGPAVLCECSHWNGSIGNVETACLGHASLIYMPVPEGRRRLAGCVEIYNFPWKNDRSTRTVHPYTQVSALITGDVWVCHMHKDMQALLQMWSTPHNRAKRAVRLKNVHPSTLTSQCLLSYHDNERVKKIALVELALPFVGKVSLFLLWSAIITSG